MAHYLLSIDQGTTSSRAIIFNAQGRIVHTSQQEFPQYFPHDGWVEHDPEDIWKSVLMTSRQVIAESNLDAKKIAGIGISSQRETTLVWDRTTGKPIYNAIVWQDRRTAKFCQEKKIFEKQVQEKTGLLLDPYFSATKIAWILDHVEGARKKAESGELLFGTVECFLLWRLTQGKSHKTDATNASRTLLFNIQTQQWDEELLSFFNIPKVMLPDVCDNAADFGMTEKSLFGEKISIAGMAGDQQAALIGQTCFSEGMVKSTYGTGAFLVMNTGEQMITSNNKLLSTIAYRLQGKPVYALEGSIFVAGAAMQWLRDEMHFFKSSEDIDALVNDARANSGVYFLPAFTGLGAPYWQPNVRGAIFGLTRDTTIADIVRAALEAICYQTYDVLTAMEKDSGIKISLIRVDGGMVKNNWMMQFLSDILNVTIERPTIYETSALGVAYLAGLQKELFTSIEDFARFWREEQSFIPRMEHEQREYCYLQWRSTLKKMIGG
jgi:glycerol kinase